MSAVIPGLYGRTTDIRPPCTLARLLPAAAADTGQVEAASASRLYGCTMEDAEMQHLL
ncbi:hypothetical protein [Pseudoclavibacter sp. 8L]|uniref:hypothetical protein n=1 Tax=Pseudoclavibacter sp. 8L TaxID=2653162 RepID=UPI00135AA4F8|nr:hypothetical protein [Pseudoclavibacter sp. 8L]